MPKMGTSKNQTTTTPRTSSLADALFSGTQQRVLGLLFGQPERSFYATELINLAGVGSGCCAARAGEPSAKWACHGQTGR